MSFISEIIIFLLGLCLGSFLNSWVLRTRSGKSILRGRSECSYCHHVLVPFDLVPVFSFLFLKGKCRWCKRKIFWYYPLIELFTGILFLLVFAQYPENFFGVEVIRDLAVVFFLEFIFLYDWWYGEIPDRAALVPGIILFLFSILFQWHSIPSLVGGVMVGTGFFLLQFLLSKGKWIGAGDIRLGFFMGVILGWPLIGVALVLAYVGGAFILLPFLLLKKVQKESKIPFGTLLIPATLLTIFLGENLLGWWLQLL